MSRDLSPALASLVQHVELSGAGWQSSALERLIVAALWMDSAPATQQMIRDTLAGELFTVPLQIPVIRTRLDALRGNGRVVLLADDTANLARAVSIRPELSGLAVKFIQQNAMAKRPVDALTYFEPYIHDLVGCLRRVGVEVFQEKVDKYRTDQRVVDEILIGQQRQSDLHSWHPKSYAALEHDAVLWHFVSDKRPAALESPREAKYWIITVDYRFIARDRELTKEGFARLPLCLHPANFVQMLQFWIPRSDELDRALMGGVRLPFLFREFDQEAERVTPRILGALGRYADADQFPPETVQALMVDSALRDRMSRQPDPEKQLELVEDELATQNARMAAKIASQSAEMDELSCRVVATSQEAAGERATAAAREVDLRESRERLAKLEDSHRALQSALGQLTEQQRGRALYRAFAWRVCLVPLLVIGGLAWGGGALVASLTKGSTALGAVFLATVGLWVWSFAVRRSARTPALKTTRLVKVVGWVGQKMAMVVLGIIGSVLGALLLNQILR